jgi:hypothetical protein
MIANAAAGCPFGGAGLTSLGGGMLAIGCTTGDWFVVRSSDGSIVVSGSNGIGMFGLKHFNEVPEPSTMALMALALLGAGLARRRA